MSAHQIAWRIGEQRVSGAVSCTALEGDECRRWCTTCDETCPGPGTDSDGDAHVWENIDYCRILPYLDDGDETLPELYAGLDDEPLRDGPILWIWDGDGYLWEYAPKVAS